jgi:DNA-binding transcriptional ArsR family regulator
MSAATESITPAPELTAKVFRAFGDPTRLGILQALHGGELSVGELVERLAIAQPQVSNHLACLRWCGLVCSRREHRRVFYSVPDERVAAAIALVEQLGADNAQHVDACERIDGRASFKGGR